MRQFSLLLPAGSFNLSNFEVQLTTCVYEQHPSMSMSSTVFKGHVSYSNLH